MGSLSIGQIIEILVLLVIAGVVFNFRNQIKKFILEVASELKKVSWTTRKDLLDSAWVVLLSSAVLGLFIGIADFVLARSMATFIR
jgi:preprotein translocase SecE subunit